MENVSVLEEVEENYKEEVDTNIKELLSLLSGSPKEKIQLIKDVIKLLLLY